jgi:hypothetical protein
MITLRLSVEVQTVVAQIREVPYAEYRKHPPTGALGRQALIELESQISK